MKNYLQRNYWETKAKYEKFRQRLDRRVKNGTFYQLSVKKQRQLVDRVKKLFDKLNELQLILKLGTAGVTMALALSVGSASGQEIPINEKHRKLFDGKHRKSIVNNKNKSTSSDLFVQVRGKDNPFGGSNPFDGLITYGGWADFTDIDSDGDLDVLVGSLYNDGYDVYGAIKYYKNVGTSELVEFEEVTGENNPFNVLDFNEDPAIRFADLDNDGDQDLIATDWFSDDYNWFYGVKYFKNTGSATNPVFEEQTGLINPFDGIELEYPYGFNFVDIDGDGDLDLFIGEEDYNANTYSWERGIKYFKNDGSDIQASFVEQTIGDNPLGHIINQDYNSFIPSFADLDGDGDFDAIIGNDDGSAQYFKNIGSESEASFEEQFAASNPFNDVWVGWRFNSKFVDYDNDGDQDALVHDGDSEIKFFENTGNANSPVMTDQSGIDLGYWAFPDFVDLDGDGDLDLIAGSFGYDYYDDYSFSPIKYYKNIGTSSAANFELQTGTNDPFENLVTNEVAFPILVDIDNDGDFDLFNLNYDNYYYGKEGQFQFFKNTGTASSPQFVEQIGIDNPLNMLDEGYFPFISFADIDGDGDYDCFVGTYTYGEYEDIGQIKYYKNTGSAEAPVFEEATSPIPEQFVDHYLMKPELVDIDMDGDIDCIVTSYSDYDENSRIYYYKNTGTTTDPNFIQQTGIDNPFEGIQTGFYFIYPSFADIDNDGDNDLMFGTYGGSIFFYKNTLDPVTVNENQVLQDFEIYPNPTDGIMKIDLDKNNSGLISVELYDYLGKKIDVLEYLDNKVELDISYLPSGMYFVKIKQGQSIKTSKIIKN